MSRDLICRLTERASVAAGPVTRRLLLEAADRIVQLEAQREILLASVPRCDYVGCVEISTVRISEPGGGSGQFCCDHAKEFLPGDELADVGPTPWASFVPDVRGAP
jgi:hypothetical protein